jgi:hypothetical protein
MTRTHRKKSKTGFRYVVELATGKYIAQITRKEFLFKASGFNTAKKAHAAAVQALRLFDAKMLSRQARKLLPGISINFQPKYEKQQQQVPSPEKKIEVAIRRAEAVKSQWHNDPDVEWDCRSCGAGYKIKPEQCGKCGGGCFEKIGVRVIPLKKD